MFYISLNKTEQQTSKNITPIYSEKNWIIYHWGQTID